jgi:hypothetical protein
MHHSLPATPPSLLGYFPAEWADSVVGDGEEHQVGGVKCTRSVTGGFGVETGGERHIEAASERAPRHRGHVCAPCVPE